MWTFNPVYRDRDILAVRAFLQSVAKAIRWRESCPDPAEHTCSLIVSAGEMGESPHVLLLIDGSVRFPVTITTGAVTVNGKVIDKDTDRYVEIVDAAQRLALALSPPKSPRRPDPKLALVNQFVGMWKNLDPLLKPQSTFEIYRMFASSREASELLRQVRLQFAPFISGQRNRFQQLESYFESRPEVFTMERSPIAGNKLWTIRLDGLGFNGKPDLPDRNYR
jgi:hypothetical protein